MPTVDELRLKLALKELNGKPLLEGVRIPLIHSPTNHAWEPTEDLRTWIEATQMFMLNYRMGRPAVSIALSFWYSDQAFLEALDRATDEVMKEADHVDCS